MSRPSSASASVPSRSERSASSAERSLSSLADRPAPGDDRLEHPQADALVLGQALPRVAVEPLVEVAVGHAAADQGHRLVGLEARATSISWPGVAARASGGTERLVGRRGEEEDLAERERGPAPRGGVGEGGVRGAEVLGRRGAVDELLGEAELEQEVGALLGRRRLGERAAQERRGAVRRALARGGAPGGAQRGAPPRGRRSAAP